MSKSNVIFSIVILFLATTALPSCKVKEGCGLEEKMAPDMESKGGKSDLFSKKQKKKMKKH